MHGDPQPGSGGVLAALLDEPAPAGAAARLRASRCTACGRVEFPAVELGCPACGGTVEPTALGPAATLEGATEVRYPPPDAKVPAPYTVVVGGFPEANLAVLGLLDQYVPIEELPLGAPLEVCVVAYEGGETYGFRLAAS